MNTVPKVDELEEILDFTNDNNEEPWHLEFPEGSRRMLCGAQPSGRKPIPIEEGTPEQACKTCLAIFQEKWGKSWPC